MGRQPAQIGRQLHGIEERGLALGHPRVLSKQHVTARSDAERNRMFVSIRMGAVLAAKRRRENDGGRNSGWHIAATGPALREEQRRGGNSGIRAVRSRRTKVHK